MLDDLLDTLVVDLEIQAVIDEIADLHERIYNCILQCCHDPESLTIDQITKFRAAALVVLISKLNGTYSPQELFLLPFDDDELTSYLTYDSMAYASRQPSCPEPSISLASCAHGHSFNPNIFQSCHNCKVAQELENFFPTENLWSRFMKIVTPDG